MSDINIFEQAVFRGETDCFFKGIGNYFVRDPDWGEHVYAAHYGSHVQNFLNSNSENSKIFEACFIDFVTSLRADTDDANHFFGNISAIIYWKNNGELTQILPLKAGTKGQDVINKYVKELISSNLGELEKKDTEILFRNLFLMGIPYSRSKFQMSSSNQPESRGQRP